MPIILLIYNILILNMNSIKPITHHRKLEAMYQERRNRFLADIIGKKRQIINQRIQGKISTRYKTQDATEQLYKYLTQLSTKIQHALSPSQQLSVQRDIEDKYDNIDQILSQNEDNEDMGVEILEIYELCRYIFLCLLTTPNQHDKRHQLILLQTYLRSQIISKLASQIQNNTKQSPILAVTIFLSIFGALINAYYTLAHQNQPLNIQERIIRIFDEYRGWLFLQIALDEGTNHIVSVYEILISLLYILVKLEGSLIRIKRNIDASSLIQYILKEIDFLSVDQDVEQQSLKQLLFIIIYGLETKQLFRHVNSGLFTRLLEAGYLNLGDICLDKMRDYSQNEGNKIPQWHRQIIQKMNSQFNGHTNNQTIYN